MYSFDTDTIMLNKPQEYKHIDGIYVDYKFTDGVSFTLYVVTYCIEDGFWYGRAYTLIEETGMFDADGNAMTKEEVNFCVDIIPVKCLPDSYVRLKFEQMRSVIKELRNTG